jgi:hypothetical protein
MYRTNLISAQLLASFIAAVVLLASSHILQFCYQPAYSHALSLDENASLLELFHQIYVQAKVAQTIFPLNIDEAHEHAKDATEMLGSKNWTTVTADRDIVRNMLLPSLNALDEITSSHSSSLLSSSSSYSELKGEVAALDNILSQFTVSYIGDRVYKNSTIQAQIISELANDISEKYGKAFGVAVNSSNMMTMMMAVPSMVMNGKQSASHAASSSSSSMASNSEDNTMKGRVMSMNGQTKKTADAINNNNNKSSNSNSNSTTILDMVDYQTAQALAMEALEIFNKGLKPVAPLDATQANKEVQRYLEQLGDAIGNRASVIDIMMIIHGYIHPVLIATYKLQLKS